MRSNDIMISKTANNEIIQVGKHCTEWICCDSFLPALKQHRIWLAGYSELLQQYHIRRYLPGIDTLLVTVSGQGRVRLGNEWQLQCAGDWTLLPAGSLVEYQLETADPTEPWQLCWILWYKNSLRLATDPQTGCTDQAQQFKLLLQFLYQEQENPRGDQSTELCCQQLLILTKRLSQNLTSSPLQQLKQCLTAALDKQWTVAEMAATVFLSERQLHRLCLQHWGNSPKHYLQLLRLRQAAMLLSSTSLSIKYIAEQTGFSNPYHFSTVFKAHYKQPPGFYRRQQHPLFASEQPEPIENQY
jgi:AraC family transcriptional regulator, activator of mtrCDE